MISRAATPLRSKPRRTRVAAGGVYLAVILATVSGLSAQAGEGATRLTPWPQQSVRQRPEFLSQRRRIKTWTLGTNVRSPKSETARKRRSAVAGEKQESAQAPVRFAAHTQTNNAADPAAHVERTDQGADPPLPYYSAVDSCCGPAGEQDPCGSGDRWDQPLAPQRLSARVEYLLWWSDSYDAPPLVTTSSVPTNPQEAGILGEPNTSILFGGGGIDSDEHSGGRVTINYWYDDFRPLGIEATYLGIGTDTNRFAATSNDVPILARPYFDVTNGTEAAMLVAHPDFLSGSIAATTSTEFQSGEVLVRSAAMRQRGYGLDFLLGWRWTRLDESLRVAHSSEWTAAQGLIVIGTTKDVFDLFDTKSQFNGAELGVMYSEHYGSWSVDLMMKLGLGNTSSEVTIDGQTVTTVPDGGSATFVGGLLAQETNIGRYRQDDFAVIPELGVTVGYNISCHLRFLFGYSFIYWNTVARPGDQIDRDVSQLPPETPTGAQSPEFAFRTSDYWTQGMNLGLEYRF